MNRRINKKIHKKYLSDIGIECTQDERLVGKLCKLKIDEIIHFQNRDFPNSFYSLYPEAGERKLSYGVKRVSIEDIPLVESHWWQKSRNDFYFVFFPMEYNESKWYVSINKEKL